MISEESNIPETCASVILLSFYKDHNQWVKAKNEASEQDVSMAELVGPFSCFDEFVLHIFHSRVNSQPPALTSAVHHVQLKREGTD